MRFIDAEQLRQLTPWQQLIPALEQAFSSACHMPERVRYEVSGAGSLLLMPAWRDGGSLGVKLVQVFPGNTNVGKPAVHGLYMLASAASGEVQAILDADVLTTRRTAATSALASRYLSRSDSRCLLLMGAGRLAWDVVSAHASVRPIEQVLVWARRRDRAAALSARLAATLALRAEPVESLADALAQADIVSTITTTREPILPGRLVRPGTHIDLIGGFTPQMREADDEVLRAGRVYVDMRSAALREAGDIIDPLERGVISRADIRGDLFDLCAGTVLGRESAQEITVFKSVGLALEDLAAATLAAQARAATRT
jgi:ornithine cyclodeaminase